MIARATLYGEQTVRALERLAALRERGLAANEDERQLVTEILEELSVSLHELQTSTDELAEQNEALLSAEGTIAAERARYAELYSFAPDGYLVTDVDGVIRDANRMACEILCLNPLSVDGRPLMAHMPLARRPALRKLCLEMKRAAETGDTAVRTLETALLRPDKTAFPCALRVIAARRGQVGEPELRWTLRDMSEQRRARKALATETRRRKRADESLLASELLYQHLIEHATDMVYELDEKGRFLYCNEQAVHRMLGYTEKELIGRPLTDFVRPDRRKAVRSFCSALLRRRGGHSYIEFPLLAKDGREVLVGQHGTTVLITGRGLSLQAICRDITAQLQRVEQLERSGERWRDFSAHLREQVEAERTRIAREVHDELGAALTVVRIELSTPSSTTIGERERNKRILAQIDAALGSVRRICSDLRPSLLDNMGLCAAIEWLAQDVQEHTHLRCEARLEGLSAEPDPDRATALFRIVQEAVTNVIRHANASQISIIQRTRGNDIVFEVIDNGRGIKPEEQAGHHAYGIAGMHERAKALGGSVRVSGSPKGTRILVHMPTDGAS